MSEELQKVKPVKLDTHLSFYDLALRYRKGTRDVLIIGDVHLGYEEHLRRQGVLVPHFQLKDTLLRLAQIFAATAHLRTIVLTGDIKHEFGSILDQEWHDVLQLIDFLTAQCDELVLLEGNHDKVAQHIVQKRNLSLRKEYVVDDLIILHGDKIPSSSSFKNARTVVIGHEHSAVTLRESATAVHSEKCKCFLLGSWHCKQLIVLPSFNLLTEGNDVRASLLSPFLTDRSLRRENLGVWVVADTVRYFGKLKDLE